MKPEYLIKIGNLFVERQFTYGDTMTLTPEQTKAARYNEADVKKLAKWLTLYAVTFTVFNVAGALIEVVAPEKLTVEA